MVNTRLHTASDARPQSDCPADVLSHAPNATTTSIAPCANVPSIFLGKSGVEAMMSIVVVGLRI
jgi:hypothetical protein